MSQKRSRPVPVIGTIEEGIDGRGDAQDAEERVLLLEDDGERTLSDLRPPEEVEVAVVESSVRRRLKVPPDDGFARAGLLLKGFRRLRNEDSRRAKLPSAKFLRNAEAWPIKRVRALAGLCKLEPRVGLPRDDLLELLDGFRKGLGELDLNETPPPLDVDLDAQQEEQPTSREETARLREQELNELLAAGDEMERNVEDGVTRVARELAEEDEALAAVHAAKMREAQERFDMLKRSMPQPRQLPTHAPAPLRPLASTFPLLQASRVARMDRGLPRPAEAQEELQRAPTSPCPKRLARTDAEVRFVVSALAFCLFLLFTSFE